MKKTLGVGCFLLSFCLLSPGHAIAESLVEDFSSDLSNWTASPTHIDTYGIVDGQLFIDGYGHQTGPGGWGVLRYDQSLGSTFTATWQTRTTYYDYVVLCLFADSPWAFHPTRGQAATGYNLWLDIDDPTYPMMDIVKIVSTSVSDLPGETRDVPLPFDIGLDEWIDWRLEKELNTIRIFVDDVLIINTYDDEFASSDYRLGLSFGEDSEGYIDNLIIHVDFDDDGFLSDVDCDDGDPAINPAATELPGNFVDENCDGNLGPCDPCADWRNHGQFVRCVAQDAEALVYGGVLTQDEGDALVSSAAQSQVGKKGYVPPECPQP